MIAAHKTAWVIAEHRDGAIVPASLEALECACLLAGSLEAVQAIVMGGDPGKPAGEMAQTGVDVLAVSGEHLGKYMGEGRLQALRDLAGAAPPPYIVLPGTTRGMDLGPAIAAMLGAAFIPGVEEVRPRENLFVRPIFNGKFTQRIRPETSSAACTVLAGNFPFSHKGEKPGDVTALAWDKAPGRTRFVQTVQAEGPDLSLTQADVVVCAGRGMGKPENVDLVKQAAALFPRSAVAGSRIACDQGWLPYKRQIGVTGQTVAPKLYMGCGVSGAFQHVAGMSGSQLVVAVNTDPKAPIFSIADYCIVEDAMAFLPAFIEAAAAKDS